jgi:hypothetical protein
MKLPESCHASQAVETSCIRRLAQTLLHLPWRLARPTGLTSRASHGRDHVQISIDPGSRFDYDQSVDELAQGVGRLKHMVQHIGEATKEQGTLLDQLVCAPGKLHICASAGS